MASMSPPKSPTQSFLTAGNGGYASYQRQTQIVCTLGPSQCYKDGQDVDADLIGMPSKDKIRALVDAGANVFRLNFSHLKPEGQFKDNKYENHRGNARLIREIQGDIERETGVKPEIKILADLQGPKCRLGVFEKNNEGEDKIRIKGGDLINFDTDPTPGFKHGNKGRVHLQYEEVIQKLDVGNKVVLADGKVEVEIVDKGTDIKHAGKPDEQRVEYVTGKVIRGRELSSNKGFNVPDLVWHPDPLQSKDREDAHIAVEIGADMIALSFGQTAAHMQGLVNHIASIDPDFEFEKVFKVEKPGALVNIDEIAAISDVLMYARGDLGAEIDQELLPASKDLIFQAARAHGTPVIVATQVMSSMERSTMESRAETCGVQSHVAGDGADYLMTSEETAVGAHPVDVMKRMVANIIQAERRRADPVGHEEGLTKHLMEMYNGKSGAVTSVPVPTSPKFEGAGATL